VERQQSAQLRQTVVVGSRVKCIVVTKTTTTTTTRPQRSLTANV